MALVKAVVPGSFDPITNGHLDIVERACRIFDTVVVTVFYNSAKQPCFTVDERVEMIQQVTKHLPNVTVDSWEGLLVDYARRQGARAVVRGLRATLDFEYEFQMGLMNKKLAPDLETLFLMTSGKYLYLSSSIVKEMAMYGAPLTGLVPEQVAQRLRAKFSGTEGT